MFRRLLPYWPFLIALLALAARLIPTPRTIDDAFITFRYARNLIAGLGFVFNPGEHVLGTTTPLYTLLLAALSGMTGSSNYPWLALSINALADALTCLVLIRLGKKLSGRWEVGLAAGGLWAIAPMSVTFAIGGMETSVFILLLTLTADRYLEGHTRTAALTSALLLLTRPDGVLLVGPLILALLGKRWREKKFPWAEAGIFLSVLAPWGLFATLYFGSPIPHSIAAKSLAYRLDPAAALIRLLQHFSTPFFEQLVFPTTWMLIAFLILYLFLSLIGGLSLMRRNGQSWPIVAYPGLYFAAFALANPLIFRWYLAPPLPFYFLLILSGIAKIVGEGGRWTEDGRTTEDEGRTTNDGGRTMEDERRTTNNERPLGPSSFVLRPSSFIPHPSSFILGPSSFFLLLSLHAWTLHPDHGPISPAPEMAWHKLELLYQQVAEKELPLTLTPQTVIAAGDVGTLGYYSNARILDTVGLISPEASTYYPLDPNFYVINYAIAPQLILDSQPDYVVILEVYGRNGLLIDPRFQAKYRLCQKIPTDIYGSDGLLIFSKHCPS
jgi:hypothetical protein